MKKKRIKKIRKLICSPLLQMIIFHFMLQKEPFTTYNVPLFDEVNSRCGLNTHLVFSLSLSLLSFLCSLNVFLQIIITEHLLNSYFRADLK